MTSYLFAFITLNQYYANNLIKTRFKQFDSNINYFSPKLVLENNCNHISYNLNLFLFFQVLQICVFTQYLNKKKNVLFLIKKTLFMIFTY